MTSLTRLLARDPYQFIIKLVSFSVSETTKMRIFIFSKFLTFRRKIMISLRFTFARTGKSAYAHVTRLYLVAQKWFRRTTKYFSIDIKNLQTLIRHHTHVVQWVFLIRNSSFSNKIGQIMDSWEFHYLFFSQSDAI